MQHEWNQTDFILEDCPIHGYRLTPIPARSNYGIKRMVYSNINQPKVFPYERNVIHSLSNDYFINQNRGYHYNENVYYNQISQEDLNNQNRYSKNYDLRGSGSIGEFADNYSFYLSGSSRLKPKVTINNMPSTRYSNQNTNYIQSPNYNNIIPSNNRRNKIFYSNTPNPYNNESIKMQRTILNNYNNSNEYLRPSVRRYDISNTEPDEIYNNTNVGRRNYYLTPNYYNDDEENNLNEKNYRIIRRNNNRNPNIIVDNFYGRRVVTENNVLPLNRRVINEYKDHSKYNYTMENVRNVNAPRRNEKIYVTDEDIRIRRSYKNKENEIPERIKLYYDNKYNTMNKNKDEAIDINKNDMRNRQEKNNRVKVRVTNHNNHRFYISNNNEINHNKTLIQNKPIKISKYFLDKINQNIKENNDLFNKTNLRNNKNPLYTKINQFRNKNDFSLQYIKDKAQNKILIRPKEIKPYKINKTEEDITNLRHDKNDKIEQQIEKYYDSQGNCIGGKKIIIKKRYKDNGEKIVKEIIKESYKPNFNELFKRHIPKKEGEGEEEGEGKIIPEKNEKNFPFQVNYDKYQKRENIENNHNLEENNEMKTVTFGIKSKTLRFEKEEKEEKEPEEQQILVNSEFEEDEPKKKEDKNDKNNIIDKDTKENINNIKNQNENIINEEKNENIENIEEIKEDNIENNIEDNLENNIEDNIENNIEDNIENNIEDNIENNIEDNLENNIEDNIENNIEANLENNIEDKKEENKEEEIINNVEVKIEENINNINNEDIKEEE